MYVCISLSKMYPLCLSDTLNCLLSLSHTHILNRLLSLSLSHKAITLCTFPILIFLFLFFRISLSLSHVHTQASYFSLSLSHTHTIFLLSFWFCSMGKVDWDYEAKIFFHKHFLWKCKKTLLVNNYKCYQINTNI